MTRVTLEETKIALKIDHDDDDSTLSIWINAAEKQIDNFIKLKPEEDYADYESDDIRLATIALVGIFYRQVDGDENKLWTDPGYLPPPVRSLLHHYRTPTVA